MKKGEILEVKRGVLGAGCDKIQKINEQLLEINWRLRKFLPSFYHVDTLDLGDSFRLQGYVLPEDWDVLPPFTEVELCWVNTLDGKTYGKHLVLFVRNFMVSKES